MNGVSNGVGNGVDLPKGKKTRRGLVDVIEANTTCVWNKKVEDTNIDRLKQIINKKYQTKIETYWDLHEWSVKNYERFWEELWHFFDVIHSKPYKEVVKNGKGFVDIEWFSGAKFNYAENILKNRNDHVAMICVDEAGNEDRVTFNEMFHEVEKYAAAFKKNGLEMGDRVACYMSNRKEAIYAMLGAVSLGGIWGGPLPFYGDKAASKIIRPLAPKFLFTVDKFVDTKQEKNLLANIPAIIKGLDCLEKVVVCPSDEDALSIDLSKIDYRCCFLNDFLQSGQESDGSWAEIKFEQLPFNYPVCINFTSGTTGNPKGLVHGAGTLLPLLRDFGLHCNLKRGDVVFTPYPVGWNLWNLFIANFHLGVTVLLYNGCPFFPEIGLWEIMDKYKVAYTFLATSIVDKMEKDNIVPGPNCKLEHLKILTMGASPVKLGNFDFLLNKVKRDLFVNCLYGATEVIGVFSGFDFNTPVYSAEIQAPALGVDIRCLDQQGNSVVGQKGELVIGTPTPSFPIAVWNDNNRKKLNELYLNQFPGVWYQSDECWFDPKTKGFVVIGRTDDILNPSGERFGSSDIYFAIHTLEELQDYICVGQDNNQGDQRVILFVRMKEGIPFTPEIRKKIQNHIQNELTVEHVPEVVLEIKDIPYNLNNKKMERIVKTIIATNEVPEVANCKNPDCLSFYLNIEEVQGY